MSSPKQPRQEILRPVGMVTQPNKFGWYVDGALDHAINCVMRNPGELDAAPTMFASQNIVTANQIVYKLFPLDSGHVYELSYLPATQIWTVTESGADITSVMSAFINRFQLFSTTGRNFPTRAKDRGLFNTNCGVTVVDDMAPTTGPARRMRLAGLAQLTFGEVQRVTPLSGGSIDVTSTGLTFNQAIIFGYVAIVTRTYADGYILASVPTPVYKVMASGGVPRFTPQISIRWSAGVSDDVIRADDVIELYRTDGLLVNDFNAEPPADFKLVQSHTVTAAELAISQIVMSDNSAMGDKPYYQTTGRALYCNPGQGGATTVNRQPPICAAMASYDGRMFYGNVTDRPRLTFKIPAGVGSNETAHLPQQTAYWSNNGIGVRQATLTGAAGSPILTGGTALTLAGVVPGQRWYGANTQFPLATAIVTAVNPGAGTVTMNTNFIGTPGAITAKFADAIYIQFNGVTMTTANAFRFANVGDLSLSLSGLSVVFAPGNLFEITSNLAITGGTVGGTDFNLLTTVTYNPNISMTIEPRNNTVNTSSMQVYATNGANYSPPLAEYLSSTPTNFARTPLKNFLIASKDQQPEHVAPATAQGNSFFIGLREIIAMASTEAALWIACLDGIYRLSGVGGQYRVDTVDSTKVICGPQCMTAMDEDVYIYTNYGMLQVDSQSRDNLTDQVIGDRLIGPEFLDTADRILCANETELEIVYRDSGSGGQNRLWVYATREGGGWTTLENNPAALSNITTLAYQRSPASGDPRLLVGVSPLGGAAPSYAGWGNTASFLTMDFMFQPVYVDSPMQLKQWIEVSYLFDSGNSGKSVRPIWNSVPVGLANVVQYQNAAYARAGCPRLHAIAQSIAAGCDSVTGAAPQARFLGLSLMYLPLGSQAKQRGT